MVNLDFRSIICCRYLSRSIFKFSFSDFKHRIVSAISEIIEFSAFFEFSDFFKFSIFAPETPSAIVRRMSARHGMVSLDSPDSARAGRISEISIILEFSAVFSVLSGVGILGVEFSEPVLHSDWLEISSSDSPTKYLVVACHF